MTTTTKDRIKAMIEIKRHEAQCKRNSAQVVLDDAERELVRDRDNSRGKEANSIMSVRIKFSQAKLGDAMEYVAQASRLDEEADELQKLLNDAEAFVPAFKREVTVQMYEKAAEGLDSEMRDLIGRVADEINNEHRLGLFQCAGEIETYFHVVLDNRGLLPASLKY